MTDKRPRVMGVALRAERRHPAYESPTPPAPRPPLERNITPWPPDVHTVRDVASAPLPALPAPRAYVFPRTGPQWAVGIATVLTALGTLVGSVFYGFSQYRKDAVADAVEASSKVERRLDTIDAAIRTLFEDQQARDIVQLAVLCELNGGSPAASVRCPPNACEPRALDANGKIVPGQVLCKSRVDWPPVRRGP